MYYIYYWKLLHYGKVWLHYIYGLKLLHSWSAMLLQLRLKVITFIVYITHMVLNYYIYGDYYIHELHSSTSTDFILSTYCSECVTN